MTDPAISSVSLALVLMLITCAAHAAELRGQARVLDGDTLSKAGERIRLEGIDAPKNGQTCQRLDGTPWDCGAASTATLQALVGKAPIRCIGTSRDRYRRLLAICYSGNVDLNGAMVRRGLALAYVRYSRRYTGEQRNAARQKVGMWAGAFVPPWEGRRMRK